MCSELKKKKYKTKFLSVRFLSFKNLKGKIRSSSLNLPVSAKERKGWKCKSMDPDVGEFMGGWGAILRPASPDI